MMTVACIAGNNVRRLVFDGSLTAQVARELEDQVIDVLRRDAHYEIDLSGVEEIDLCGLRLLGLLGAVAGNDVRVVGSSPAVRQNSDRMVPWLRNWLRGYPARQTSFAA